MVGTTKGDFLLRIYGAALNIFHGQRGKKLQKEIDPKNTVAIIISIIEQKRTAKEVKLIIIAVDMFVSMVLVWIICSAYSGQERLWRECYKGHFLSVTLTMGLK